MRVEKTTHAANFTCKVLLECLHSAESVARRKSKRREESANSALSRKAFNNLRTSIHIMKNIPHWKSVLFVWLLALNSTFTIVQHFPPVKNRIVITADSLEVVNPGSEVYDLNRDFHCHRHLIKSLRGLVIPLDLEAFRCDVEVKCLEKCF